MTGAGYPAFLARKRPRAEAGGISVPEEGLHPALYPFQRHIVRLVLERGRAAIFAATGLGKTIQQLEWARHVHLATGAPVLILAPLAVTHQTAREGAKLGLPVQVCRSAADLSPGVNVTNYDLLDRFEPEPFAALVCDEASILKSFEGPTRKAITAFGRAVPLRLSCTATPAPNDLLELASQAEFLGVMESKEVLALFFTQDEGLSHQWRLKGHARREFWRWVASWAVAVRMPSDLGFPDDGFELPPLRIHPITVASDVPPEGALFAYEARGLDEVRAAMKASLPARVAATAELANGDRESWILWCHTNPESAALAKAIPDAVELRGSESSAAKEAKLVAFSEGQIRVLVTKPSLAGFGLNWQHCARVAFVGLSYSWEAYYQAIRRCWRYGQQRPVECYVISSEAEGEVVRAIERKEAQAEVLQREIVAHMSEWQLGAATRSEMTYRRDVARGDDWTLHLGDAVECIDDVESESVGLALFSPPFPSMYAYTNSARDMGNVRDIEEMLEQFRYLIGPEKLLRTLMPGRHCCVHLTQALAFKHRDGYIGRKDFRGRMIQVMEEAGWIFYGEATIEKNPQMKAVRTKDRGLLFQTLATDSSHMHMALADYLLQFRKPGDNPRPIRAGVSAKYGNPHGWITPEEWITWASPVWWRYTPERPDGIRETDVLNVAQARETDDERHLCPLQLGVIERAVKLWTNPGELVLSPFAGIGSEGVGALRFNRRFEGFELKESYWRSAVRNLQEAARRREQGSLFSLLGPEEENAEDVETEEARR